MQYVLLDNTQKTSHRIRIAQLHFGENRNQSKQCVGYKVDKKENKKKKRKEDVKTTAPNVGREDFCHSISLFVRSRSHRASLLLFLASSTECTSLLIVYISLFCCSFRLLCCHCHRHCHRHRHHHKINNEKLSAISILLFATLEIHAEDYVFGCVLVLVLFEHRRSDRASECVPDDGISKLNHYICLIVFQAHAPIFRPSSSARFLFISLCIRRWFLCVMVFVLSVDALGDDSDRFWDGLCDIRTFSGDGFGCSLHAICLCAQSERKNERKKRIRDLHI